MKWTHYQPTRQPSSIFKAGAIALSIVAISSGISFAALTSQDKLTGNTISTATANLGISIDGVNFGPTQTGLSFAGIVPGGQAVPIDGYDVLVKNIGSTSLALKLSVSNTLSNPDNVDLNKVHVILEPFSGGSVQNFSLQALIDSNLSGGIAVISANQLTPNTVMAYRIRVSMETDAVNSASATVSNLDFNFNGVVISQ